MRKRTGFAGGRAANVDWDTSDFDRRFPKFMDTTSIDALKKGLAAAGKQLIEDILEESPRAPKLTSALRSSISLFVNQRFIYSTRAEELEPDKQPENYELRRHSKPKPKDAEEAIVVVNAPYATFQHEVYHRGFVTKKLFGNASKYLEIAATTMKRELRSKG